MRMKESKVDRGDNKKSISAKTVVLYATVQGREDRGFTLNQVGEENKSHRLGPTFSPAVEGAKITTL